MMTVNELKNSFIKCLNEVYPKEEILSFFHLLTEFHLNMNNVDLALNQDYYISKLNQSLFQNALKQLKNEIPIQYIIGETEFYGLTFKVNNSVLIPRPETEELVEWIINSVDSTKKIKILDIGTGSGCIAISLAKNLPNAQLYAFDVSKKALETAKKNAENHQVEIYFKQINILETENLNQHFNVIVSNPPYVRELEKKEIKSNVLDNEPHLALFVKDKNPLLFYDKISELAKQNLTSNGILFFEINQYLGKETKELLQNKNYKNIELRKDLFENDRMLKASL